MPAARRHALRWRDEHPTLTSANSFLWSWARNSERLGDRLKHYLMQSLCQSPLICDYNTHVYDLSMEMPLASVPPPFRNWAISPNVGASEAGDPPRVSGWRGCSGSGRTAPRPGVENRRPPSFQVSFRLGRGIGCCAKSTGVEKQIPRRQGSAEGPRRVATACYGWLRWDRCLAAGCCDRRCRFWYGRKRPSSGRALCG